MIMSKELPKSPALGRLYWGDIGARMGWWFDSPSGTTDPVFGPSICESSGGGPRAAIEKLNKLLPHGSHMVLVEPPPAHNQVDSLTICKACSAFCQSLENGIIKVDVNDRADEKPNALAKMDWAWRHAITVDCSERDGKRSVAILVDMDTYMEFFDEIRSSDRFFSDFEPQDGKWRGIPIERKMLSFGYRPVGGADVPGNTVSPKSPFLISVRYEKAQNGRIVYIDHPDTDARWK